MTLHAKLNQTVLAILTTFFATLVYFIYQHILTYFLYASAAIADLLISFLLLVLLFILK